MSIPAPDFELENLDGKKVSLVGLRGQIVLLNFWSAECPWSERADRLLAGWYAGWAGRVAWISVAANAGEPLEMLLQAALERGLPLVLLDPQQAVTDAYHAQTTPHVFVIDAAGILRYQGGLDDITFRKRTPERFYALEAVEALLAGRLPEVSEAPPFGCTIVRYVIDEGN
jgi:peroxiredoxin